jgi:hypothetical protein
VKVLAKVMDNKWVFGGNMILNFSAVQYSLDHPDYVGRGGSPDCQGIRTTELKLRGIENIQETISRIPKKSSVKWK